MTKLGKKRRIMSLASEITDRTIKINYWTGKKQWKAFSVDEFNEEEIDGVSTTMMSKLVEQRCAIL